MTLERSRKWTTVIEELSFKQVPFYLCNTIHLDCHTVGDSKEEPQLPGGDYMNA